MKASVHVLNSRVFAYYVENEKHVVRAPDATRTYDAVPPEVEAGEAVALCSKDKALAFVCSGIICSDLPTETIKALRGIQSLRENSKSHANGKAK